MLLKIKETFFPPPAINPDTLKTNQVFDAIVSGNPSFLAQFPIQEIKDFTFTNYGRSILHIAVWYNCLPAIDAILKNEMLKQLLNEKDLNAESPLHLAVYTRNFEAYKKLIKAGANTQIANNKKERPIDLLDDSEECTEFLKKISNTESLFTSIPNDRQTDVKHRLTQQPKISFKVTLIPTETEVISDEALHKKLTDKTSLQGDADNDETQSMEHPHDNSIANMVPSLAYGDIWTASRKGPRGGTMLSNGNSASARIFKDSTAFDKSSWTNNLLDPNSHSHSHHRFSLLSKKSANFDDISPKEEQMINQFSATSDVLKVSYIESKISNVNGDEL